MLRRAVIIKRLSLFSALVAWILLTGACFTIVTKPQDRPAKSKSMLPGITLIHSVEEQPGDGSATPGGPVTADSVQLTLRIEPANGGAVIVSPHPRSVVGVSAKGANRMPGPADTGSTDLITVRNYPRDTRVRLEAVPEEGYWFSGWKDGCANMNLNVCVLTVSESVYASAVFSPLPSAHRDGNE